jgi:hypothetical protein
MELIDEGSTGDKDGLVARVEALGDYDADADGQKRVWGWKLEG